MLQKKDSKGRQYVRIQFQAVSGRKRTCWALKIKAGKYLRADAEGGVWEDPKAPANVVRNELILTSDKVKEEPAAMNLKYGELEVLSGK